MKTNSRRRVLISSVAMLLVALVALSTATFAWFTSSTSVTADGIKVRTSKTSKLEICSNSSGWKADGFTYDNVSSIMFPASSANGTSWFTGSAVASNNYTAFNDKGVATFTQLQKTENQFSNKYVYANMLGIKNAGDVPVKEIKIEISNAGSCQYLRYAIVPVTATGVTAPADGGVATMADGAFAQNIYAPAARTWAPVVSTSAVAADSAKLTSKTDTTINVTTGDNTLAAGGTAFYNVFVWFEGQDEECKDANAGGGITAEKGLTFQVTGTPVSES